MKPSYFLTFILAQAFAFAGCRSISKSEDKLPMLKIVKVQKLDSSVNLSKLLEGQKIFIKEFYTPSKDPYTGRESISPACEKANQIGEVEEAEWGLYLKSNLFLNHLNKFGGCPENPFSKNVIYIIYSCKNSLILNHGYFELSETGDRIDSLGALLCK